MRRKDFPVMVFCFFILMTFGVKSIVLISEDSFITFLQPLFCIQFYLREPFATLRFPDASLYPSLFLARQVDQNPSLFLARYVYQNPSLFHYLFLFYFYSCNSRLKILALSGNRTPSSTLEGLRVTTTLLTRFVWNFRTT